MAENTTPKPVVVDMDEVGKKPNRIVSFINKHPRITKAAAVTATAVTAIGGVLLVKNMLDSNDPDSSSDDYQDEGELEPVSDAESA